MDTGSRWKIEGRPPDCAIGTACQPFIGHKAKKRQSVWVFPGDSPDSAVLGTSLAHMHAKVCRPGNGKNRTYPSPGLRASLASAYLPNEVWAKGEPIPLQS